MTRNYGSGSFSHRREMDQTATQTSNSSGSFAGGNGSYNDVLNSISHDLETQSESSMSGTDTETHQGNTVTWSQAGSGSASGFVQSTNGTGYSANWGIATNCGAYVVLNVIAIIPVIGVVKNFIKGADVAKQAAKNVDEAAAALKQNDEILSQPRSVGAKAQIAVRSRIGASLPGRSPLTETLFAL